MLDIAHIRQNVELVRKNLETRQEPDLLKLFDDLLKKDEAWRKVKYASDTLRSRRNSLSQEINAAKKAGKDIELLKKESAELPKKLEASKNKEQELKQKVESILLKLPNLLHDSVPYGRDDSENVEVEKFGKKPAFKFDIKSHVDILEEKDLVDTERAAKISGSRWYFMKGKLAQLELALIQYAVNFMVDKGFTLITPPNAISHDAYKGVTSMDDFEDVLYKIEGEDLHLIATAEHPLTAMFRGEVIDVKDLPLTLVGFSPCYRKEAGTHGRDEKGIFRVHQFNKVEQVVVCPAEDSWDWHEIILSNAKEFFDSLGLHCRIVNICTGDIGIVAAKKYDIEAWFPHQKAFREVVSCSNCTSYQAVRSNIRLQKGKDREWAHTLNSTCVATTRALAAILENFQQKDGSIKVPKVLQKYCGFDTI